MSEFTVKKMWESFNQEVIASDAPQIQRDEMRKAFYGGFSVALKFVMSMGDDDTKSEDDAVKQIEDWAEELMDFAAEMSATEKIDVR